MIVVTGATGNVAGELVRVLADADQRTEMTAAVRQGRKAPESRFWAAKIWVGRE